jgi:hypothetical protein
MIAWNLDDHVMGMYTIRSPARSTLILIYFSGLRILNAKLSVPR